MNAVPKQLIIRDPKYLIWLRDQPCIITGERASDFEAVDPMHIGTAGKGLKSSDDEVLPVIHRLHLRAHQKGEVSVFRDNMPDWLLREALRAYAREFYRTHKQTPTTA